MTDTINKDHRAILDQIRKLYRESGGDPLGSPEDFGLNRAFKSRGQGIELCLEDFHPVQMYTPQGSYTILGSYVMGGFDKVAMWSKLNKVFVVDILETERPDLISRTPGTQERCVSIQLRS